MTYIRSKNLLFMEVLRTKVRLIYLNFSHIKCLFDCLYWNVQVISKVDFPIINILNKYAFQYHSLIFCAELCWAQCCASKYMFNVCPAQQTLLEVEHFLRPLQKFHKIMRKVPQLVRLSYFFHKFYQKSLFSGQMNSTWKHPNLF